MKSEEISTIAKQKQNLGSKVWEIEEKKLEIYTTKPSQLSKDQIKSIEQDINHLSLFQEYPFPLSFIIQNSNFRVIRSNREIYSTFDSLIVISGQIKILPKLSRAEGLKTILMIQRNIVRQALDWQKIVEGEVMHLNRKGKKNYNGYIIKAEVDSIVMLMEADMVSKVTNTINKHKKDKRVDFIQDAFLGNVPRSIIEENVERFDEVEFSKGRVIYDIGDKPSQVFYILKRGAVEVVQINLDVSSERCFY